MFKFQGKIKVINETQVISEKFKKREFVVTDTSSMYPQDVMFQSVQDKCDMLNGYSVEDQVEVSFNLRGREWTSPDGVVKYFNTLDSQEETVGIIRAKDEKQAYIKAAKKKQLPLPDFLLIFRVKEIEK